MFTCQSDEQSTAQIQSNIQTVSVGEAKDFLTHSKSNSLAKMTDSKLENLEFDKATLEKINGSDQLLTVIPFTTNREIRNDRVLIVKINDEIRSVVFSMQPDENSVEGHFSGKLLIYSLQGDFIAGYGAKDGIIEIQYIKNNSTTSSTSKTIDGGELKEVIIPGKPKLVNAVDWDMIWGSGGSSIGYSPSGGASGMSWDAIGGGGSSSGITAPTSEAIAIAIQKKINADKLSACLKNILDDLININAGPGNMINKFSGNDPSFDYNWTMETGTNNLGVSGNTLSAYNATTGMTTRFDIKQFPNATELSWAKTMLHEAVHAYLITYFNRNEPGFKADYPVLFQKYTETKLWNSNHHEEIAQSVLQSFGVALESYGISKGYKLDKQFYQDMAWGGLEQTDAFAKLPLADRRRISDTLSIELRGEDDYGNKKTQKGKKAGC
jgi:hypothetical protein